MKKIDTFFERQDTRGYKFDIDPRGNVFIVEMEKAEHGTVVGLLQDFFKIPNRGVVINPPIDVLGALCMKNSFRLLRLVIRFIIFSCPIIAHYRPRGRGKPSAPNIAIYPGLTIIPKPPIPAPPPQRGLGFRRRNAPRASRHLEIPPVDKSVGSVISDFVPNFP